VAAAASLVCVHPRQERNCCVEAEHGPICRLKGRGGRSSELN
jgi:hypothetical protein